MTEQIEDKIEVSLRESLESNGEILDSWYQSRDDIEDKIDELKEKLKDEKAKLRKLERERAKQPAILTISTYLKKRYKVTKYQILDLDANLLMAEEKEELNE